MAIAAKESRKYEVQSPLGEGELQFRRMDVSEELGRLFVMELDVERQKPVDDPNDLLGESVTVSYEVGDGEERYFNGFVSEFLDTGLDGDMYTYRLTLRPWFWFLTLRRNCRIFQDENVRDIIKKVLEDYEWDVSDELKEEYSIRPYCVQYRESDFDFLSRLMEDEGIYYYFEHSGDSHDLVLADDHSSHKEAEPKELYFHTGDMDQLPGERIYRWNPEARVQPGACKLTDYEYEKSAIRLEGNEDSYAEHAQADYEVYDYPGGFDDEDRGRKLARIRLEGLQVRSRRVRGASNSDRVQAGFLFTMSGHPIDTFDGDYLWVSSTIRLRKTGYRSGSGEQEPEFDCTFEAIPDKKPYRSESTTPRPMVRGPQTAVVVGKSGENIWTDEYGRIKVQFHWDLEGSEDENSSCWVRVAQPWAGAGWGFLFTPHIGQEVVVEFLEGDPDRPLVVGAVYNKNNQIPSEFDSPEDTTSGILCFTGNEIRLEDAEGEERLYIHAVKDRVTDVDNDSSLQVGNNLAVDAGNEIKLTCGQSELVMKSDGTVTLNGTKLALEGKMEVAVKGAKVEAKADGQLQLKGGLSSSLASDTLVDINSSVITKISGTPIKIN